MKRILALYLFILVICPQHVFAQRNGNVCLHKDRVRDFVKLADSIARFVDDIKRSVPSDNWDGFLQSAGNGNGQSCFNYLGAKSEEVRRTYNELGAELDVQFKKMIDEVKTNSGITDADVKTIMLQEIACYFADTVENNAAHLYQSTGREAPPELGGEVPGPCETALRSCMSGASSTHTSQLMACGFGTAGIIRWLGGWWGLGTGVACLLGVESTYNNAKWTCIMNYADCTRGH